MPITPAATANMPVISPRDAFGHKAPKLAALLGLSSAARVLLIGDDWRGWQEDLMSYFPATAHPESLTELESILSSEHDLIVLSFRHDLGRSISSLQLLEQLHNNLSPSGSIFFVAENRFSLSRIGKNPFSIMSSGMMTAFRCRHQLARFECVEEFLPLPRFVSAEEFVSSRHGETALPAHASALEVGLNRIGLLSYFHDGWVYIASNRKGGTSSTLETIARELRIVGSGGRLVLERFDLRDRGALVLMLRAIATGRRFVCRITTDEGTDRSVRLNAEWIGRVQRSPSISADVKELVPHSLASFAMPSGAGYTEELIPGTIAWKLAGNARAELPLLEAMGDFIYRFNRDTATAVRVDDGVFTELMKSPHVLSMDHETLRLVSDLESQLRTRLLDTDRWLVWAHGDFGYGNAIADPKTAALRGIIDWDQGRVDLAGVDLMNFLVAREHARTGNSLVAAFRSIAESVLTHGFRGAEPRFKYDDTFPLGYQGRLDVLAWVALRITQRAAIYPALFANSRAETQSILRWAYEALGQ